MNYSQVCSNCSKLNNCQKDIIHTIQIVKGSTIDIWKCSNYIPDSSIVITDRKQLAQMFIINKKKNKKNKPKYKKWKKR